MTQMPTRLANLAARLTELEIDAMLVTNEINVRYLSGFTGDSSCLLVEPGQTTILSDGRYDTQIATQCPTLRTAIRGPSKLLNQLIQEVVRDAGVSRLGIEADDLSFSSYQSLSESCGSTIFAPTTGVVEAQRMLKDDDEIKITREAVRIAEKAMLDLLPTLNEGWSERAIAHELESKMRSLGAEGCSFAPIVAEGASGALPHYEPSDAVIGDSSTLLIDWGAKFQGYASDLTRTFHRETASTEFCRAYEVVLEAQLAAIDKIGPGVPARDVDAAARGVLEKAGLGDAFKHGLGHGTGLQIHEAPRMSSISEEELASGMIITVEPGVYFAGDFGIRIEDDVLVTETGREVLSRLPKGLDDCRIIL